ncbi:MAG: putative toxin-antitoxin system toxin component, PIN family [Chloroflexota bacterium]
MRKLNIVIDTNVIYTALHSKRGASSKLLSLVGTGLFEIHLSVPLVLEYEDVLLRKNMSLPVTKDVISEVIDSLCALGHHHEIHFLWRPYLRDPKDELVLEIAVASQSKYIITYNVNDFTGAEEFGIKVMTPKEFLQEIGEIS